MRNVIMYGVDKLYGCVCKLKEELDKIRIREMNANKYVIWKEIALDEMELSVRTYNCLKRAGIRNAWDLMNMSMSELKQVRNLGRKSLGEVLSKMQELAIATDAPSEKAECKLQSDEDAEEIPDMTDDAEDYVPIGEEEEEAEDSEDPYEKLDTLIGLKNVKKQVSRIAALARLKKDMEKENSGKKLNLNMEFIGNPGTAKTTVARIMAEILYKEGITRQRKLYEVGRADLVGRYVGETAQKVTRVFHESEGAVLFIDEAYSLVDDTEGSYGDEAINTIVQEMENRVGDTIVIFAGYPERMEAFFERNPGLRSRVPFSIAFDDYSSEELVQIASLEAEKHGFVISEEAEDCLREGFEKMADNLAAGNGRICRNIVEDAVMNYAERIYGKTEKNADAEREIKKEDIVIPEALTKKKKSTIGFAA